ncbi:hypothetical protein [Tabrizicola flagellatus]|uniref:hypothetical protein n=1 Tax=Tabrizicola flagellatus TaxID=2593021 RepID=UPI0011F2EAB1|nr:hypothetical protein [Tabrizicola flagellatus]
MGWSERLAPALRAALAGMALAGLAGVAAVADPVTVTPCGDYRSDVRNVAEPWEANTRTFARGEIRLVVIDTVEPAAAALYLLILHPPRDELGSPMCSVVTSAEGLGFADMGLGPAKAIYDPARGLTVSLPVSQADPMGAGFDEGWLSVTINQATGVVTAVVQ